MLHLFDDLWLDKIIPKNNDRYRTIYGNLENKINTLYWPVKNSIHKITMQSRYDADGKLQKVSGRCLILCRDHYVWKKSHSLLSIYLIKNILMLDLILLLKDWGKYKIVL